MTKEQVLDCYGKIREEAWKLRRFVVFTPVFDSTSRRSFLLPINRIEEEVQKVCPGLFHNMKRIRQSAEKLRAMIRRADTDGAVRHNLTPPVDRILHECRIMTEEVTGGFWYDPVAVRSRKVSGG